MFDKQSDCPICQGKAGDAGLQRIQVWEDALWRLTVSLNAEILGFAYLEPKRHISYITDLDGEEARTFGDILARVSRALRAESGATQYVSKDFPPLPESAQRDVARRVQQRLMSE